MARKHWVDGETPITAADLNRFEELLELYGKEIEALKASAEAPKAPARKRV